MPTARAISPNVNILEHSSIARMILNPTSIDWIERLERLACAGLVTGDVSFFIFTY
jgi:hypothetical protein